MEFVIISYFIVVSGDRRVWENRNKSSTETKIHTILLSASVVEGIKSILSVCMLFCGQTGERFYLKFGLRDDFDNSSNEF